MVELAGREGPVLVRELAGSLDIPQPFLAKLLSSLVKAGILNSTRGRNGGVSLGLPPERVTLAQVIRAIEGERFFEACPFLPGGCPGDPACPLSGIWDPVREELVRFLEETDLRRIAEVIRRKDERAAREQA